MTPLCVQIVAMLKFRVFWDVASCNDVEVDRRFRGAHCLHHQGDDEGSMYLWNVGLLPRHYTSSGRWRRQYVPLKRRSTSTTLHRVTSSHVEVDRRFRGTPCLHQADDEGSTYLWNVGLLSRHYTALHLVTLKLIDVSEVRTASIIRAITEAVRTSETSAYFHDTTQRYITQSCHFHTRRRENLKSR
jgi:hypothetical protein